jgi:hypothetical protein
VDKKLLFDKNVGPMLSLQIYYNGNLMKNNNQKNQAKNNINGDGNINNIPHDCVLAALATFNTLLIISIEPTVDIVYKSGKPEYVKEGSIPYLSWGTGILPGFWLIFNEFI